MSVPEGRYTARAVNGAITEDTKGGGQAAVVFQILEGDYQGHEVTWYGSFNGGAAPITMKGLQTAGARLNEVDDFEGLGSVDVQIVLKDEEFNGVWRTKVAFINPLGGFLKPMDAGKKLAFKEQMKGALLAFKQNNPAAPGGAPRREAPARQTPADNHDYGGAGNSDLPF